MRHNKMDAAPPPRPFCFADSRIDADCRKLPDDGMRRVASPNRIAKLRSLIRPLICRNPQPFQENCFAMRCLAQIRA